MAGRLGSHRAGHSSLLLSPIPEPGDGGSRFGIEGSTREVVGDPCLQQDHRAVINLGVLWRDYRGKKQQDQPRV